MRYCIQQNAICHGRIHDGADADTGVPDVPPVKTPPREKLSIPLKTVPGEIYACSSSSSRRHRVSHVFLPPPPEELPPVPLTVAARVYT